MNDVISNPEEATEAALNILHAYAAECSVLRRTLTTQNKMKIC